MSSRLAFQTQLASIMEALANAAVAEICKLVDDDQAVVRLQMTQCQTENKVLKRKLHLLELKMARGTAERRLRESVLSRPRVQVHAGDRPRLSPPPSGKWTPAGPRRCSQDECHLWGDLDTQITDSPAGPDVSGRTKTRTFVTTSFTRPQVPLVPGFGGQ